MPIAYQEQAQLSCPACGADFEAPVWLILDAQEEPAAVEALRRGELNSVACPHCGAGGPAGAPLLYHDGAARRVIFAPAPGSAEHEWREQARDLHALLVGSIPEEQRRPYLADVDIAQDLAGVAHLLRRMDSRARSRGVEERRSAGAQETTAGAERRSSAPPLPSERSERDSAPAGEQGEQAPLLLQAVQAMLGADAPEELDTVLAAYPILLDVSTDATLAQLADVAVEQRAYEIADSLRRARAILLQMTEAARGGVEDPRAAAELSAPALTAPALQALLQAQSGEELAAVAAAHPLLLRPEVDALLAEQVELALDEGNERLAQAVEERREALAALRAAEVAAPAADEPTLDEAIEALLIAEGEDALAEVIDRYPVLLDDVASAALWQFAAEARASGDEDLARYAVECREMLRRVREGLED
jgi:hypothetical protein